MLLKLLTEDNWYQQTAQSFYIRLLMELEVNSLMPYRLLEITSVYRYNSNEECRKGGASYVD